jgi:hypothetical protein
MPQYTFNWTNNTLKTPFTVNDMAVNTLRTDLKLYGRGARSYGEGMQENMLHLLENFASDIPPPTPTQGQLWYNTADGTFTQGLKLFDGTGWISANDTDISGFVSDLDSKVNRVGDTMSGYLTLNDDPVDPYHSATKLYVDTGDAARVGKSGDTMTGFLTLHADPVISLHAATKAYVDYAIFQAFTNLVGPPSTGGAGTFRRAEIYATTASQTLFSPVPTYTIGDGSLWGVYVNGVRQPPAAYTQTSTTSVTLSGGVSNGDEVLFDVFTLVSTGTGVQSVSSTVTSATAGQTVVTVPSHTIGSNLLMVWVNGVKQVVGSSYTETLSTQITFSAGLTAGSTIEVVLVTLLGAGAGLNYQHDVVAINGQTSFNMNVPYIRYSNPADPLYALNQMAIVFVNGIMQGLNEYVEVNGTSILLSGGTNIGDHVEIYVFDLTP